MITIRVLLENTAREEGLHCAHGLSMYVRTPGHKLLFDAGPNDFFARNAETLGVDLSQVDMAVLSHGHYDHSGGLEDFFRINPQAPLYLRREALDGCYSKSYGPEPKYIGLSPALESYQDRMRFAQDERKIDRELMLFSAKERQDPPLRANSKLLRREGDSFCQDDFRHEINLLITSGEKAVLLAGCAHSGIVPIMAQCEVLLGRAPDIVLGGFHLFAPRTGETEPEELIREIGRKLAKWPSRYYTGHCTGEKAYGQLKEILGDRLQPLYGGLKLTIE